MKPGPRPILKRSRRHQAAASMWRAMETKATRIADELAAVHETRRQWEALTEPSRRVAVAADIELRRRHPDMDLEPLKSAEPQGIVLRSAGSASRPRGLGSGDAG